MSVTVSVPIGLYPYPGFEDPALPAGSWAGVVAVEGDASGGAKIANIVFAPAGQALGARMFSMEQWSATDENNAAAVFTILSIALGKAGPLAFDSLQVEVGLVASTNQSRPAANDMKAGWGTWLGRVERNSTAAVLQAQTVNSDGDIFIWHAQGYFWEARSLQAPGGPRRPAQGMYAS